MSRSCAPFRILEHGGHAKRNARQPHVPSVKVTIVKIRRYQLPIKDKLLSKRPMQMIQDRTTNKARGTLKHSMGIVSIQPVRRHSVIIQVRRYEDENQQKRT